MYRSCAEFSQRNAFFIHLSICLFVLALHALIIKDITLSEELKVEHRINMDTEKKKKYLFKIGI